MGTEMTLDLMPLPVGNDVITPYRSKSGMGKKLVTIEERRHLHVLPQPLTERRQRVRIFS